MHTVVGAHDLVIVLSSRQFRQRVVKPRLRTSVQLEAIDGHGERSSPGGVSGASIASRRRLSIWARLGAWRACKLLNSS